MLSVEHKKAISESLKLAHKEKRHPGWLNANRNNKSYPEKLFEKIAKAKGLFDRFDIIDQFPFHGYFFDYAIIDCAIDVEIDGVQHYRTIESIEHDRIRDEFTLNEGWKVYRISAKELKDNPELEVDKLIEFLDSESKYRIYDRESLKKHFTKYTPKYGNRELYGKAKTKQYEEGNLKYISLVLESNIDFSKFGWVGKVSKIINQKPGKVKSWMLRFMPEFYDTQCFKKK